MSATLGSLALAGVMQSTGAVATETVGNVLFVDFVAGTVIPQYAAATGTTAAAVEAGIASGVTIGTGGLILIGAAALAIIAGIIAWWISTHPKLDVAEDITTVLSQNSIGDLIIGEPGELDYSISPTTFEPLTIGTGFSKQGDKVKLYEDLYLVLTTTTPSSSGVFQLQHADGTQYRYPSGYSGFFAGNNRDNQNRIIDEDNPAMLFAGNGIYEIGFCTKIATNNKYAASTFYGNGFLTYLTIAIIKQFTGIDVTKKTSKVDQKKKQNALEIPQLDPNQELAINTGAATFELPNPNLDEIKKYMNEQVNNPASDPAKGFNYQPPFEVKDVQLPNPKPGDIPITPPVPAPEIPSEPVTPPNLPVQGSTSSGMVRLWNPTPEEMGAISKFMLSGDFIDQVVKLFADPADYLLSLSLQPVTPSVSAKETIYIGSLPVPTITVSPITSQYSTVEFGSIEIPAVYNSFVDYDTQFSIFLPCIGEQPLNTQDMIGSTIHLQYNVDVLTGTFAALLRVTRSTNGINLDAVLYQWQGNLAAQIPIRASSWNVGITDIAAGALAGAAGGPYGALAGAGVALGKGLLKPRISGSGSLSGNAGLLGIQYPYLIINRPRTATPSNYKDYSGVSTSEVTRLGDLSGYTMVQDTHLQGIPATSDELDEILSLLKGGVIL